MIALGENLSGKLGIEIVPNVVGYRKVFLVNASGLLV